MIVCHCKSLNDGHIQGHIDAGQQSFEALAEGCGAGSVCGGCRRTIARLLGSASDAPVYASSVE